MISQHLPVVRGEDNHPGSSGFFTACFEVPDEGGDLFIDMVDQSVIPCLDLAQCLAFEQYALPRLVTLAAKFSPVHPITPCNAWQVFVQGALVIFFRRKKGRMGGIQGSSEKEEEVKKSEVER